VTAYAERSLVLRLAGPLQSWGSRSQFNRRDTVGEPTKSGVVGLLAAAGGRRRTDSIEDLLGLRIGVRTDQPGSMLRDYHTVSDYRGRRMLSAAVTAATRQKPTSPAKTTHVTERYYLQDAVFVAAVGGPTALLDSLAAAVLSPAFPLALGRRACVPGQPILLTDPRHVDGDQLRTWPGDPLAVLQSLPWQGSVHALRRSRAALPPVIDVPITIDDPDGDDSRPDVPVTFDPKSRAFTSRRVRHAWAHLPVPESSQNAEPAHDPFALLGW
jgi:CRISPR system Cascade subunit CasD